MSNSGNVWDTLMDRSSEAEAKVLGSFGLKTACSHQCFIASAATPRTNNRCVWGGGN